MIIRRVAVIVVSLLIAIHVVRNAAVANLAAGSPAAASSFWANHPNVEVSRGLLQIAEASRQRKPIGTETFQLFTQAAVKSPLAPEPFLVRGVREQTLGNMAAAKGAFAAAQRRDPRSLPAAYFLADYYLRTGDVGAGLQQTALLARLAPRGSALVATAVAEYARDRSNWPQLRELFRTERKLQASVLAALARDARNADAVLALADRQSFRPEQEWTRTLLQSLVAAGDYQRARSFWSALTGAKLEAGQLVYDPDFSRPGPPPPFNWALTTSTVGLAERQAGQRLNVIYYGNQDGPLARQLLVLPGGAYRLQSSAVRATGEQQTFVWSVKCANGTGRLATASLDQVSRGVVFRVPGNCPAQWLELLGVAADVPQQAETTVTQLRLIRESGSD